MKTLKLEAIHNLLDYAQLLQADCKWLRRNGIIDALQYLQGERFILIKLDEQHGLDVVATHGQCLLVEAAAVERANQVTDALALHTHLWCQDVVSNLQQCGQLHIER